MQQISQKLLQSVYRQAVGILSLDEAEGTATVANTICCRPQHTRQRRQQGLRAAAVDYRIAAPPVKLDTSGTADEVRSLLVKIGRVSVCCSRYEASYKVQL